MRLRNLIGVACLLFTMMGCNHISGRSRDPYDSFRGEDVGTFLKAMGGQAENIEFVDEPPGRLQGCILVIPGKCAVKISVKNFRYVSAFDVNRGWDKKIFLKERISTVESIQ